MHLIIAQFKNRACSYSAPPGKSLASSLPPFIRLAQDRSTDKSDAFISPKQCFKRSGYLYSFWDVLLFPPENFKILPKYGFLESSLGYPQINQEPTLSAGNRLMRDNCRLRWIHPSVKSCQAGKFGGGLRAKASGAVSKNTFFRMTGLKAVGASARVRKWGDGSISQQEEQAVGSDPP